MRRYKITVLLLALFFMANVFVPATASTGYGPGAQPNVPPFVPVRVTNRREPRTNVIRAQILTSTQAEIQRAIALGSRYVVVPITNTPLINATYLQEALALGEASNIIITFHICTRIGDSLVSRMFIDSRTTADLTGSIDFAIQVAGREVNAIASTIRSNFTNNFSVIRNGHNGSFGRATNGRATRIRTAVMIDLSGLDVDNLRFYAFNDSLDVFTRIITPYGIDEHGFLHFFKPVGGIIIVTDSPLTVRR